MPLLLVHSINAAANAYEIKPLFEHYARSRPVYAFDLPGYGLSDRRDRIYTPRLMTDALIAVVEMIRDKHGIFPIDAVALSLSNEFLARRGERPSDLFRSLGLIAPTGSIRSARSRGRRARPTAMRRHATSSRFPAWGRPLFDALTSRVSIRFFLQKTFGSKRIDEGLFRYAYASAHQPDAEHAPFSFLSGFLFSKDALTLFKSLAMPVWMAHGTRGDFVDYKRKTEVEGRPNWTIQVFETGAMPQFERLGEVTAAYDAYLGKVAG